MTQAPTEYMKRENRNRSKRRSRSDGYSGSAPGQSRGAVEDHIVPARPQGSQLIEVESLELAAGPDPAEGTAHVRPGVWKVDNTRRSGRLRPGARASSAPPVSRASNANTV